MLTEPSLSSPKHILVEYPLFCISHWKYSRPQSLPWCQSNCSVLLGALILSPWLRVIIGPISRGTGVSWATVTGTFLVRTGRPVKGRRTACVTLTSTWCWLRSTRGGDWNYHWVSCSQRLFWERLQTTKRSTLLQKKWGTFRVSNVYFTITQTPFCFQKYFPQYLPYTDGKRVTWKLTRNKNLTFHDATSKMRHTTFAENQIGKKI